MSLTTATDELRGRFGAEIILPDDPGYDEARALHNAMIDKRPAVIVRCGSADDIVGALEFARTSNLAIAVRGGGHNGPGFGSVEGGLVVSGVVGQDCACSEPGVQFVGRGCQAHGPHLL